MYKNFFKKVLFIAIFLVLPGVVKADVIINEVAWMGTADSQYEEWIELYNNGSDDISLDGWKIYKAGGDTSLFSLSGNISSGQYLLVCRTTNSVPNPLSGICDLNGAFGGSGLNNTSEDISLVDDSENIVDNVDAISGWQAGDSSSKETMQLNGSDWITAVGTPGEVNSNSDNNDNTDTTNSDDNTTTITTANSSESSSNSSVPKTKIYSTMLLNLDVPKNAIAGSPAHFKAQAFDFDRSKLFAGHYVWNMGDGNVKDWAAGYKNTNDGFDYIYEYPGTYSVSIKYYHSFLEDVPPNLEQKFIVEVMAPTINISKVYPDGSVELKNVSKIDVDLSNWQLRDYYGSKFIFPEDTFILKGKTTVFPDRLTKLKSLVGVYIFTPNNSLVDSYSSVNTNKNTFISVNTTTETVKESVEKTDSLNQGLVLGAQDFKQNTDLQDIKQKASPTSNIWVLAFIILIVIATITIFFLKKEEKETEEGYELIDE